jgi:hypothetical protein
MLRLLAVRFTADTVVSPNEGNPCFQVLTYRLSCMAGQINDKAYGGWRSK